VVNEVIRFWNFPYEKAPVTSISSTFLNLRYFCSTNGWKSRQIVMQDREIPIGASFEESVLQIINKK
jgi:hypothetical protein